MANRVKGDNNCLGISFVASLYENDYFTFAIRGFLFGFVNYYLGYSFRVVNVDIGRCDQGGTIFSIKYDNVFGCVVTWIGAARGDFTVDSYNNFEYGINYFYYYGDFYHGGGWDLVVWIVSVILRACVWNINTIIIALGGSLMGTFWFEQCYMDVVASTVTGHGTWGFVNLGYTTIGQRA